MNSFILYIVGEGHMVKQPLEIEPAEKKRKIDADDGMDDDVMSEEYLEDQGGDECKANHSAFEKFILTIFCFNLQMMTHSDMIFINTQSLLIRKSALADVNNAKKLRMCIA